MTPRNYLRPLIAALLLVPLCSLTFGGFVWESASFPGGSEALNKFVSDSLRYPAKEKAARLEAVVDIHFDISKEGKVMNPVAGFAFGNSPGFTEEAVRMMRSMPLWKPATRKGKPVDDRGHYLTVKFELPDSLVSGYTPSADTTVYTEVDSMPVFPGGDEGMFRFLMNHIHYPQHEKEMGVMGTVYISYTVEQSGRVSNISVKEEVPNGPGLTKESMRVVSVFPRHTPAKKNGKAVRYRRTIPVKYVLM